MQIELIATFLDLTDTLSFNRTAERLGVTQSTVSSRVRALEAALGRQLFTRSRSGTRITLAGRRFVDHARALQHEWTEACRSLGAEGVRQMRIGIQNDLAPYHIGPWLTGLRAALPETAFYFEIDYSSQMLADVLAGALDLAMLYTPEPTPDLHFERIGEVRYQMVSTHAARLAEVEPDRYIRGSYSPAFDAEHRHRFGELHRAPVAAGQSGAVCGLLTALGGSAFVLEAAARELAVSGVCRTVADVEPIAQPVHGAVHIRRRHLPAIRDSLRIGRRRLEVM